MSSDSLSDSVLRVPAHEQIIADLETLKVLADPLRLRIRELLTQPATVKQISAQLNIPVTKLYCHINLLEKHGLIMVVESRLISGVVEKVYQVSAYRLQLAPHLLTGANEALKPLEVSIRSVFDSGRQDLLDAIKSGAVDTSETSEVHRGAKVVSLRLMLTEEQARALFARIDELLAEFNALNDANRAQGEAAARVYRLFSAAFPSTPPAAETLSTAQPE
jgi:DNA-binding transcriptional ArsR family regulator